MIRIFIIGAIFQMLAAMHALQTGRDQWTIAAVLIIPGAWIVYLFMDVLPKASLLKTASKALQKIRIRIDPNWEIRPLLKEVERCDTVDNRQRLAQAYMSAGKYEFAATHYKKCREIGSNDAGSILLELAYAEFFSGHNENVLKVLSHLEDKKPDYETAKRNMLQARVLEKDGQDEDAMLRFRAAAKKSSTAEAKCRLALILRKLGKTEEAKIIFRDILNTTDIIGTETPPHDKKWVKIAQANLKDEY
ncbi:MAG: hypothetical protein COB53_03645 [Elusimicrobia bacterium]|nr:MAG: hypothetical protein COB53_03645 [Elusimicrobiota bacterium]